MKLLINVYGEVLLIDEKLILPLMDPAEVSIAFIDAMNVALVGALSVPSLAAAFFFILILLASLAPSAACFKVGFLFKALLSLFWASGFGF